MTENQYLVAIFAFNYFGSVRIKLLLSYFKKAQKIWTCSRDELSEVGLPERRVSAFLDFRKNFDIEKYFNRLCNYNIKVTTIFDADSISFNPLPLSKIFLKIYRI